MSLSLNRRRQTVFGRLFETLEDRTLFHDGVALHVAFALPTTPIPEPYDLDSGKVLSAQDDGVVYGWATDNETNVHERHGVSAPEIEQKGYAILPAAGQNSWSIQVPDDDYSVTVVAGDAQSTAGHYKIDVNGSLTVNGKATAANPWVSGTQIVTATNDEITLTSAPGTETNKIDYIDIIPFDDPDTISVAADSATQSGGPNGGAHGGGFIFTRQASVSSAATYQYVVGGSATAGSDYDALSGNITFPVGVSSVEVPVTPDYEKLKGDQTVMATLVPGLDFDVDQVSAVTTIQGLKPISALTKANGFSTTRIQFQTSTSPVPPYYRADTGATYGLRANGMTYGWSANESADARDHSGDAAPDERYDLLAQTQKNSENLSWSMAVPNGTYTVRVVAGDPDYTNSTFKINVNGVLTVNGTPTSSNHWVEGTQTVNVTNGKITISNATGAVNNKINFVEINPGSAPLPVVSIAASGSPAVGSGTGTFSFSRTGITTSALTVNYSLSGTAVNGTNYSALSGSITIPAGSASASATFKAINTGQPLNAESVVATLTPESGYSDGQVETASRTIPASNITTSTTGKLSWSTKAAAPIARSEAMGAVVNGNVYAFGGYIDSTYHPVARVDEYNIASNKWTQLANMPFGGITHAGTTVDGNDIYLAGGYPASATKGQTFSTRNVWQFNTTNDTWTAMPPLPEGRGAGTMVNLNHVLYFFGGADPNRADAATMWKLDLNNLSAGWNTVASIPAPRNHVGGVALDGYIYALGGQTGQDNLSVFKGDVWRYDPSTNKWTTMASLPNQPRSHIAAASFVYNGQIIAEGGEGPGRVALNYVQEYNPSTNVWTNLTPLPSGRSSGIGVNLGNGQIMYTSGYSGFFDNQTWVGSFSG